MVQHALFPPYAHKGEGLDSLHPVIVKAIAPLVAKPLTALLDISFVSAEVNYCVPFSRTCYMGRFSLASGCAGINGNNRITNCRCPSSAILRRGDPKRHPVMVSPSEAVDGRATEVGKILLRCGLPRFKLAATLLKPMHWGRGVDNLADDFTGST